MAAEAFQRRELSEHDAHLAAHPVCQVCGEGHSVVVVGEGSSQLAACVLCFSNAPPAQKGGWAEHGE